MTATVTESSGPVESPHIAGRGNWLTNVGLALVIVSGAVLLYGSVSSIVTLTSNHWCNVNEVSCYGAYSANWLGLGTDSEAPQLGDWASSQGLAFIGLGLVLVALASGLAVVRPTRRPRVIRLIAASIAVALVFVLPLLWNQGVAPLAFDLIALAAMFAVAVCWGTRVIVSLPRSATAAIMSICAASIGVGSLFAVRSLSHFAALWVTPHSDGWQIASYSWQRFLIPDASWTAVLGVAVFLTGLLVRSKSPTT